MTAWIEHHVAGVKRKKGWTAPPRAQDGPRAAATAKPTPDHDNAPLATDWPRDPRVIQWLQRFTIAFRQTGNKDPYPTGGSTAQFAALCLFLKFLANDGEKRKHTV